MNHRPLCLALPGSQVTLHALPLRLHTLALGWRGTRLDPEPQIAIAFWNQKGIALP